MMAWWNSRLWRIDSNAIYILAGGKKINTLTDSLNALVILLTLKVISIGIN